MQKMFKDIRKCLIFFIVLVIMDLLRLMATTNRDVRAVE